MKIKSAEFIKSVVGTDEIFEDGTPQIVFIGRSNVGKSSVINSFANQKNLGKHNLGIQIVISRYLQRPMEKPKFISRYCQMA